MQRLRWVSGVGGQHVAKTPQWSMRIAWNNEMDCYELTATLASDGPGIDRSATSEYLQVLKSIAETWAAGAET